MVDARTAKNSNEQTSLTVKLVSLTYGGRTYPLEATVQTASVQRVRSATTATDAKKVAGAAILGAIAGQVIGKNTKGTVIGAAAGAAAGTAAAAATANYDTCINAGAAISATLNEPVTVRPVATP
jgi:outer membrane lipoprotein SlyB